MNSEPILVVPGEKKSIFFEIFFKSTKSIKIISPLILICNKRILDNEIKKYKFRQKIEIIDLDKILEKKFINKKIYLIDITNQKPKNYIQLCFKVAFKLIKKGLSKKLINGPINKSKTFKGKYLGVTEYVAKNFKKKNCAMLIYNEKLSVCPVTTHLPLKSVTKKITKKLIREKIEIIDHFFKKFLNFKPKIGIVGLNPHCESIFQFNEDAKIISPVVNSMKKKYWVRGPIPADTIFLKNNRKKFNVIIGMYHDQVLTPIKTIYEYDAINITIGLPFLRVTPDHGPNESMVGKNISDPRSLIKAISFLDKK